MARMTVNHDRLESKAGHLRVRYMGQGTFLVASGSRPGIEHYVDADPYGRGQPEPPEEWRCGCEWGTAGDTKAPGAGRMCSHVRAASRHVDQALALAGLARYAAPAYATPERVR